MNDPGHDLTRLVCEGMASVSKFDSARGSVQQSHSQFILELVDLPGERGLAKVQSLRCSIKVQLLRQNNEIPKLSQLHGDQFIKEGAS
jgi:hypothetical protein